MTCEVISIARARVRRRICEGCGCVFPTDQQLPYCCDGCADAAYQVVLDELDAQARAAGYASFDDYAIAELGAPPNQCMRPANSPF